MPIVDVEAGCASGGAALQLAAGAIRAGQYDCVLVFGVEKMPKGIIRSSFFEPWREEAGLAATPAYFALRAQRLLREAGLTKEHLAEVVVKNRRNGVHNPNAMFRKEVTAEEVLASRVVCEPLHLWMLCSPNEGAAAVVLRRGDGGVRRGHARGGAAALAPPRQRARRGDAAVGHRRHRHHAAVDARRATTRTRKPGIGPDDLDVVECQDTDAARELLAYQELGLCAPGEQAKLLARRDRARRRSAGQPERRAAVEGRAARRVGARAGRRARAPAARRGRAPPGRRRARRARAHRRARRQRVLRDRDTLAVAAEHEEGVTHGLASERRVVPHHGSRGRVGLGLRGVHRRRRASTSTSPRASRSRAPVTATRASSTRSASRPARSCTRRPTATAARCPEQLADRLAQITPPSIDTFFFTNSGAEATEAAVKLARHATGRPNVIVVQGGFHGRTYLTMAMTTSKVGVRAGYQPLPAGIFATSFPRPFAWGVDEATAVERALADLRAAPAHADRARARPPRS